MTFFINSWSHTWGRRPYSHRCSARDNGLLAVFTFGEGYHNFHHAFQHDYRNGVKAWQFDPTKWCIWLLHRAGLATDLRRVSEHKILMAQVAEQQRQISAQLAQKPESLAEQVNGLVESAYLRLQSAADRWATLQEEYRRARAMRKEISRERLRELRREFRAAAANAQEAFRNWRKAQKWALLQLA
jgi:stearoyl-CoA desaturase (delta-9 desaturase)